MFTRLRAWRIRRSAPRRAFEGVAAGYRLAPTEAVAEALVQLTRCPACCARVTEDCRGTTGPWNQQWLHQGADLHVQPRFHAARVDLATRHTGARLFHPDDPPTVKKDC